MLTDEIEKLKLSEKAIIVEGIKDREALQKLGLKNIFVLSAPIFKVCENVAKKHGEVVILTDLDKEGKLLYSKIKEGITNLGIKIDESFRDALSRTKLVHVQGLDTYIENLMFP